MMVVVGVLLLAGEVEAGGVVAARLHAERVRDADVAAGPCAASTAQTSGCCSCSCSCLCRAARWEHRQRRRD